MTDYEVLPLPLYIFFVYVEPFLTVCGAIYAWCMPETYFEELVPRPLSSKVLASPQTTQAGIMAVRQLGNCYIILACMSFFVLPRILAIKTTEHAKLQILRTFFAILAFADITHIVATLIDLRDAAWKPATWNTLAHGNTTLVIALFVFRMWFFRHANQLQNRFSKVQRKHVEHRSR